MRRLSCPLALAAGMAVVLSGLSGNAQGIDTRLLSRARIAPSLFCGTTGDLVSRPGTHLPATATTPGQPMSFLQDPPILAPDYTGTITLRGLTVVGDVPSLQFTINFDNNTETWTRIGTAEMDGRIVSIFQPSWPASILARQSGLYGWGWDAAGLPWGEILPPNTAPGSGYQVWLRIASANLPTARVQRLADDVQFSANVVNLVVPDFGHGYVTDDAGFDLAVATRKFYQYFEDSYDAIALVPQDNFLSSYLGYHVNVQNDVSGIGLSLFDRSESYGSVSHRLHSVELFNKYGLTSNESSSHEIAHQWGDYIDWTRLTGLVRAGHQPASHDPLWADGETRLGGVLSAARRVRSTDAGWEIQKTPAPGMFHPFTRYAMGLLSKDEVPTITLFDNQAQFSSATVSTPNPGRAVVGATRTATVFNVIGMLGERTGPVPSTWDRATVVVSRGGLLTQREMDYWTYFAQRVEDPHRSGMVGYDGVGSFDLATDRRIDLRTDIRPQNGGRIVQPLPVDFPEFSRQDWRDVEFDEPVQSRYRVGQRIRWSGRIKTDERNDFDEIIIRLWKDGGDSGDAIRWETRVSEAGTFIIDTEFDPRQKGVFQMEVFLFWPGSGSQYPRASVSPITIE